MTIRVNTFEISFGGVAFCIIILTVYSTGCYDKCFKNGNTKSFSKTQFMVHPTE